MIVLIINLSLFFIYLYIFFDFFRTIIPYFDIYLNNMYNIFQNNLQNFIIYLLYKFLYLISYIQIHYTNHLISFFKKYKNNIVLFINSNENYYECFEKGILISKFYNKITLEFLELEKSKFDLIIFNNIIQNNDNFIINKILINIYPLSLTSNNSLVSLNENQYSISNINFISLTLNFNEKEYEIILQKNGEYNYYICGNIINKYFIIYYLINILKVNIEYSFNSFYDNFKYSLILIDNNVSLVFLNENDSILIHKDNYEIINSLSLNNSLENVESTFENKDESTFENKDESTFENKDESTFENKVDITFEDKIISNVDIYNVETCEINNYEIIENYRKL